MKYREHRGDLNSSMETTIEIEGTKESLYKVLHDKYGKVVDFNIVIIDGNGVFGFTDGTLK